MTSLGVVVKQLRKERDRVANEVKRLDEALDALRDGSSWKRLGAKGNISVAGRARIAAAQRARWAKVRAKGEKKNVLAMPRKRPLSADARRKIAAAQRARWAKVKAAEKSA